MPNHIAKPVHQPYRPKNPQKRSPKISERGERSVHSVNRHRHSSSRVSDRTRVALQTGLAMVLAYWVALAMDWEKPYWAGLAVATCALGSVGESLHKGMQRMLGTMVALVMAFVVLALFIQDRWAFLFSLSLWTAFCGYMSMTSARGYYFWFVAGFALPLLTIDGGGVPAQTFDIVVLRAQETLLGVLSFTLVAGLLLPVGSGHILSAQATALVASLRELAADGMSRLSASVNSGASETNPKRFEDLRTQATRALGALPPLLAAAELDTYAIWESRHDWRTMLRDLEQLARTLERLRQNHRELAEIDLGTDLQGLDALMTTVDTRLRRVEALLPGLGDIERGALPPDDGDASADAIALDLDLEHSAQSAFDRAALALTRRQLTQIERLTAEVSARVEAIASLAQDHPGGARRQDEGRSVSPFSLAALLEPERLRCLARQQSTFWLAVLCLFYIPDVPLSNVTIVLAASLSMALNPMPQVRPQILFVPVLIAVLFAGWLYLIVMPHLGGFPALAALLFSVTFLISWLFHAPSQVVGRSVGLSAFVAIIAVDNQQVYSFQAVANLALGLPLIVLLLVFTTYFPFSFRAEDRTVALIARWFRSASWVFGTLGTDAERAQQARSPGFRSRLAFHRQTVEQVPQMLATWIPALPAAALGDAGPAPLQRLATEIRAMSLRIDDLLEARDALHSPAMERALAPAVRQWRLVVRDLLARSATDPAHLDPADLRRQLVSKLRQIETLTEQAMDEDPGYHAHQTLNENSYRLLGAYRGLSESLVDFAQAARAVDWESLEQPRF
jgi:uncharacterized membrane protein YccC